MADIRDQAAFMKEVQTRFDRKLRENEIDMLEQWKEQLDKLLVMKPDGIASLQLHIKKISDMMANRIKMLKRS